MASVHIVVVAQPSATMWTSSTPSARGRSGSTTRTCSSFDGRPHDGARDCQQPSVERPAPWHGWAAPFWRSSVPTGGTEERRFVAGSGRPASGVPEFRGVELRNAGSKNPSGIAGDERWQTAAGRRTCGSAANRAGSTVLGLGWGWGCRGARPGSGVVIRRRRQPGGSWGGVAEGSALVGGAWRRRRPVPAGRAVPGTG